MDTERLHKKIVREIIALIASGTYRDGERLPAERSLCGQFEVSRGTLRKALATLEQLGVVSIKPNSGIYVHNVSPAALPKTYLPPDFDRVDLADIIDARRAIETAAVETACRRITARQIRQLRTLIEKMAEAIDDLPAFLEADMAFHQALVRASGNRVLVTAFESIYEYHRFSSIFTSQQEGEERAALDYHRKLLAALGAGKAGAARRILAEHLEDVKKYSRRPARSASRSARRVRARIA